MLAAAVALSPDGAAVVSAGTELTYRQLDSLSNRLARHLIDEGIGPEDFVAVSAPRSQWWIVALWAVSKAGAAFVPVDPAYPSGRIGFMVANSGVRVGITVAAARSALPDSVRWIELDRDGAEQVPEISDAPVTDADRVRSLRVEHPAYVIYTSGSTGRPKGVVVTHSGIATLAWAQRERFATSTSARVLAVASPSFDASVFEMLLAAGAGATSVVAPADVYGGEELAALVRAEGVTHAVVTPRVLTTMDPEQLESLGVLITAGEALIEETVGRWSPGRHMYNAYGPTETTIWATGSGPLQARRHVTIGQPVRGVTALVLDARLHPVAGRRARGTVPGGRVVGPRLSRSCRSDRRAVRGRPVRRCGRAALPDG